MFWAFWLVWLSFARLQPSNPFNSRSFCDTLHATYSSCRTRHCRECTSISPCTRRCFEGQNSTSCVVRNCCYDVRVVVIYLKPSMSFVSSLLLEAGFAPTTTTQYTQSWPSRQFSFWKTAEKPVSKFSFQKQTKICASSKMLLYTLNLFAADCNSFLKKNLMLMTRPPYEPHDNEAAGAWQLTIDGVPMLEALLLRDSYLSI